MPHTITLILSPKQAADKTVYIPIAARRLGVGEGDIALARIVKRSIDARGQGVKVNLTLELFIDCEPLPAPVHFDYPDVSHAPPVVIVGGGPAGLFAALRLIELGYKPLIVERGREVAERKRDIAALNRNEPLDPDSNYAFGEGGAGTFSDGKLFTRSKKRGDYNKALQTLVFHGADPEILYDSHPHIGTDKLPGIMTAIRKTIVASGGEFFFNARVEDIIIEDNRALGVVVGRSHGIITSRSAAVEPRNGGVFSGGENLNSPLSTGEDHCKKSSAVESFGGDVSLLGERIEGKAVILATGHSADDIYGLLHRRGVMLEAKPFAMGVRVEHQQELIDTIQYHGKGREYLPAATYSLVAQTCMAHHGGGRGVYSFCMCPGGIIVPAMTDPKQSVVNGMSSSLRNSRWANSGIVTEVKLSDFEHLRPEFGSLAGLEFRRRLEHTARQHAGQRQTAPAQRLPDFIRGRASGSLPSSSYVPGLVPSRLDKWLPEFISAALREGFQAFGRRMRGFITPEAIVAGVESRTSSPVRIPRDADTLAHPIIAGLYPAGEGAGYAGGIISAALDGERVAEAVGSYKL